MTRDLAVDWPVENQAHLACELDRVAGMVERHLRAGPPPGPEPPVPPPASGTVAMTEPSSLQRLVDSFGLSPFERDVLILAAGYELDGRFAARCAEAGASAPTFGLALAALGGAHWSALTPVAPLRYWKMVELAGEGLVAARIVVDERILHYLAGVSYVDERVYSVARPSAAPGDLPPSQHETAEAIARLWLSPIDEWQPIHLEGGHDSGVRDVAATAAAITGLDLHVLHAVDVPLQADRRELLCRLWDREAVLNGSALLVQVEDSDANEVVGAASAFVATVGGARFLASRQPLRGRHVVMPRFEVQKPTRREQSDAWRRALGPLAARLDGHVDRLVNQFDLAPPAIDAAAALVTRVEDVAPDDAARLLWDTCRRQSRQRLDDLAQRLEKPGASWDDLVLPEVQTSTLRDVVTHVRQRARVYEEWGFAATGSRGLGISALFSGPSGTGKTLAAEVMAGALHLDLYKIDLSQVVSKYIGETEKNLRSVFDAAEAGGALLLFDEADALFGKRSEVKDSHDRYANIEVSYLLQRMEAYRGLAILTTNTKQALDPAFTRRIRFFVEFPFPDADQRAEIWRRVFPAATPTDGLDVARLARLNVAGGNIRNIALGAAFIAAEAGHPVGMDDVLAAARAEYSKLERPLTAAETGGWTP